MRPHLRPAGPAGCCPQRELHPPAGSVPVLASSPADLAAWRRRPTRNPSPSSSGRRSARPGEPSSRSHDVTGGGARPTRTQRLPSMNFRQRGQMRQRLRAICRFGWHGPSASQGEPHWNAGRTADRSRAASPSLTHAPAGRHSLDAAWPRTEALGWRGGAINKPRGRGAAVSGYYVQVSGVRRAGATQEISGS